MFENLGVKLACLFIALLLWVQVASNVEVEQMVRLPLRVEGLADSLAIHEDELPATVSVRIRGSRLQLLLADIVSRELGRVTLDLTGLGPGRHRYDVSVLDVRVNATALEVVPPVSLDLQVLRKVQRLVPVRLVTEGELPEGFVLAGRAESIPSRVEVSGPEDRVETVESVRTRAVRLGRRRASFRERVPLVPPGPGLALHPVEVDVEIGVDAVIERRFEDVPVTVLSDLPAPWITVVPTSAAVVVRGARSVVEALAVEEVSVLLPIDETIRGVAQVAAQVAVPDGIVSFSVEPATFQVIVDEGQAVGEGGR